MLDNSGLDPIEDAELIRDITEFVNQPDPEVDAYLQGLSRKLKKYGPGDMERAAAREVLALRRLCDGLEETIRRMSSATISDVPPQKET